MSRVGLTLDPVIMPCVEHLKVCVQVLFITQTKGNCMSRVGLTLDPEIMPCVEHLKVCVQRLFIT